MTNWPWPLNGVQEWFEGLWNNLVAIPQHVADLINDSLVAPVLDALDKISQVAEAIIVEAWQQTAAWTKDMPEPWRLFVRGLLLAPALQLTIADRIVEAVWAHLPPPIRAAVDWLRELSKGAWDALWGFVKDPVGSLHGLAKRVWDLMPDWMRSGLTWLGDLSRGAWDALWRFVQDPVGSIQGGLNWLRDELGKRIQGGLNVLQEWLSGALAGVGRAFYEGFMNFIDWVKTAVLDLAKFLMSLFMAAKAALGDVIMAFLRPIMDEIAKTASRASPPDDLKVTVENLVKTLHDEMFERVAAAYASPPVGEAVVTVAMEASAAATATSAVAQGGGTAADATHPVKNWGIRRIISKLLDYLGMGTLAGAPLMIMMETGLFRPLRYYYNKTFTPYIPDDRDVVEAAVRGLLDMEEYYELMREHGYNESFADMMLKAAFRVPGFSELREMLWRDAIDTAVLEEALRFQGVREDFVEAYKTLIPRIPGPSDLIRFVVREVITTEDFIKWMARQGYDKFWSDAFWEAHWELPGFGLLREAWWRGVITDDEFKKYVVWHDYKPEPRPGISKSDLDILFEMSYELPGRIDARWMYEQGAIDDDELRELYKSTGLHPRWLEQTVAATAATVLRAERESVLRELMYDYRDGWITREDFIAAMEGLGIPPRLREFWLARADMLADRERREEAMKAVVEAFRIGVIDDVTLKQQLMELGMVEEKAEHIRQLEVLKKVGKMRRRRE